MMEPRRGSRLALETMQRRLIAERSAQHDLRPAGKRLTWDPASPIKDREAFGGPFALAARMNTRILVACMGALLLVTRPVAAQPTASYLTTFSANLDVVYHEKGDDSHAGAHFDVAGTVKPDVPRVELVGEAGFNRFEDATVAAVLAGARIRIPIEDDRFLPFGQALFGLYHCSVCNENDPALQVGGGVDFRLPGIRAFRLRAQADFRHMFTNRAGFDALRLSGGIVLPLSGR